MFSGIGGISLALQKFGAQTCLYCETDGYCREVLEARMASGGLDAAPIHEDVKTLEAAPEGVNMIVGGFPCQDLSTKGHGRGIVEGAKSSLFFEIVRLIDASPGVDVVFLENVPNIVNLGLKEVEDELVRKRGWRMEWTIVSAAKVGAPHLRKRWFGLAWRERFAWPSQVVAAAEAELVGGGSFWAGGEPVGPWPRPPGVKRCCLRRDADKRSRARCMRLGNSVVPQAVRRAFATLVLKGVGKEPPSGNFSQKNSPLSIHLEGRTYTAFPTPIRSFAAVRTLKHPRQLNELANVLLHCDETRADFADELERTGGDIFDLLCPNPEYVEWMMGYDAGWTACGASSPSTGDHVL